MQRASPFLLAVPYLIGIAVLKGLTVEIDTFHGSDAAIYQLPTIVQFREGLDFSDYPSAQTPLFHLVMAGWSKLVGFELWRLRLLNVAISYGAALALLRLLRRTTSLGPTPAFALTLAFALSPYVFGASFTLLTDNLAILFALLALERVHAYAREGSLGAFALACLWTGGGGADAPVLPLAGARPGRLPRTARALAGTAARGWGAAGGGARTAGGARDRVERAGAAQRGPGLVRALHRQAGRRARLAHAAHGRVHARGWSASTRSPCSGRAWRAASRASTGGSPASGSPPASRWC